MALLTDDAVLAQISGAVFTVIYAMFIVPKSGKNFEDVSKLFDHAAHNGSNYLNGHCFVSVMLCVPVWNQNRIRYISVPLGYRMWQKKESKLELAASMVRQIMSAFTKKCDHSVRQLVC